jgi:hypothetical protein
VSLSPPTAHRQPATEDRSPATASLRAYFASGWAFFIPYLAAYLLYAWLKWPANPPTGHRSLATVLWPPALLHVYWTLHVINAILGVVALRSWWCEAVQRAKSDQRSAVSSDPASDPAINRPPATVHRQPSPTASPSALGPSPAPPTPLCSSLFALRRTATAVLPWLFLTLIFAIPGIYLEWPSDPWEHLRRINEWHIHDIVTAHSSWTKSSYFFPYSLTGHVTGLTQLSWLNVYYTAICLLLCWQYYRLGRAVGLSERTSFVFVLLQALLFGNNVFSFYRYYGLSSSIFAQLGAVALTRIVLEWATGGEQRAKSEGWWVLSLSLTAYRLLLPIAWRLPLTPLPAAPGAAIPRWIGRFALCALLLVFVAFNHVQGLGIAGLGILAVAVWRLIEWKRAMIGWLVLAAIALSVATVLWFPRHPALDAVFRPVGWLTAWYGFNLFSPASPAFDRTLQILGAVGIINLIPGLWLALYKNHIAGWLTLMPVLALALPCVALPLAHVLVSQTRPENIITFQRFLFAVPIALALVATVSLWAQSVTRSETQGAKSQKPAAGSYPMLVTRYPLPITLLVPCTLLLALVLAPGRPDYNHLWQSLQVVPDDLQLTTYTAAWTTNNRAPIRRDSTLVVASPLGTRVREVLFPSLDQAWQRHTHAPLATAELELRLDWLDAVLSTRDWTQADAGPISGELRPDWRFFSRPDSVSPGVHVIADLTASNTPWLRVGGSPPKITSSGSGLLVGNPVGIASQTFAEKLVPVDRSKRYQLSSVIRQTGNPAATNYLAVAWYDEKGKLLPSNQPRPAGAGAPVGWSNGTYSYYGLVNRPASATWTHYTITFGVGETAAIPSNAAFLRAGVLLNYHAAPGAIMQLKEVDVSEKSPYRHLLFVAPAFSTLHTPASQAARMSEHWPAQQAIMAQAGTEELRARVRTFAHRPSD